jgi:UDP-N-acetylmuramoylalanine-D-glutamate ligase
MCNSESSGAEQSRQRAAAAGELFVDVAVIGAGLQGITVASFLRKEGIDSFLLVDEVRARSSAIDAGVCAPSSCAR